MRAAARRAGTGQRAPGIFRPGCRFVVVLCSVSIILQRAVNVPKARCHHDPKREIGQNIRQIREHQRRPPFGLLTCSRTTSDPRLVYPRRSARSLGLCSHHESLRHQPGLGEVSSACRLGHCCATLHRSRFASLRLDLAPV